MANFQPPPTYAMPILVEETTDAKGEKHSTAKFAPVWLKWFLDLAQVLSSSGATSGTIVHNDTSSKQGGMAGEFYHLTAAEYAALAAGSSSEILATRSFRQVYTPPLVVGDDSQTVLVGRAFRQVASAGPVAWDDAQNIIANQVFGG